MIVWGFFATVTDVLISQKSKASYNVQKTLYVLNSKSSKYSEQDIRMQ